MKNRLINSLLTFLFVFGCNAAVAEPGRLDLDEKITSILAQPENTEYLVDPANVLNIETMGNQKDKFKKIVNKDLRFPTSSGTVWIKFNVDARKYSKEYWFLASNYEHSGLVTVYYPTLQGYKYSEIDENVAVINKIFRVHNYLFRIPRFNGDAVYYIKYQPRGHNVIIDLSWFSENGIISFLSRSNLEEGLFFGGLITIWFYNLFLYVYLKEKTYLYYIYYLSFFIGTFIYIDGFMPVLSGMSQATEKFYSAMPFLAVHGMIVFGRNFLGVKKTKSYLFSYLKFGQTVTLIGAVSPWLLPRGRSFDLINIIIVTMIPALILAGASRCYQGYKPARFYLLGWLVFGAAVILLAFKSLLIIPESWLTDNAIKFGCIWEAVVFSFALALRLRYNEQVIAKKMSEMVSDLREALDREKQALKRNVAFIAAVNHELRSPLQRMIGAVDSVISDFDLGTDDPRVVRVRNIAEQIVVQMKDIGEFSRLEADVLTIRKTDFEIEEVLEEVVENVKDLLLNKDVKFIIKSGTNHRVYYGDKNRIVQIVSNLVQNAIKFTSCGEIILSCNVSNSDNESISGIQKLEILVSDTGEGIAYDEKEKVFSPFWQADAGKAVGGSGLGLAIVKKLVNLLGGHIEFTSEQGIGTTFIVTLNIELSI